MNLFARLKEQFQPLEKMGDWQQCEFLVLDMETTGLDVNKDRVVSIGWVIIKNGAIKLDSARRILLKTGEVGEQSVGIHMITDEDIENEGRSPESVMRYLIQVLRNKILVVHHAPMDVGFLKKLWQQCCSNPLSFILLDTLAVERNHKMNTQQVLKEGDYRLNECRARYKLPEYHGHDALTDALATAELMMAQIYHIAGGESIDSLLRLGGKKVTFIN